MTKKYEKEYYRKMYFTLNPESYRRMKYFFDLLMRENLPSGSSILEIGCGKGIFLKVCEDNGMKAAGVDVSGHAVQQAKKIVKGKVLVGDIEKGIKLPSDAFDALINFDLFEHLSRPYHALKEMKRLVKPGGIVVISAPNANSVSRLLLRSKWMGFCDETHIFFFTPFSLSYAAHKCGFTIIRNETYFHKLPLIISTVIKKIPLWGRIWLVLKA